MSIVYSTKRDKQITTLEEALKDIRLNSKFGKLPLREDMFCLGSEELEKQWDKLRMLRKHINIVNEYIDTNKGETINEWLWVNNKGLSHLVVKQIGNHNNETGGITAYVLNLEEFYNNEEKKYDEIEKLAKAPDELKKEIEGLRKEREDALNLRKQIKKVKTRDLKKNKKGYLLVDLGEPIVEKKQEETVSADANETNEEKEDEKEIIPTEQIVNNAKRTISIMIAGTVIVVTAFGIVTSLAGKK